MVDCLAFLIEDDPEQTLQSTRVLEGAGFVVRKFDAISPALSHMESSQDLVDLFVLDRRLPMEIGEQATDELGDELLRRVRLDYPDSRIIVFTGWATIQHVQTSMQGSGQLPANRNAPVDRITVLEKDQSLEFKECVEQFRALIQELEDIEVRTTTDLSPREKRILRRVAFYYKGDSITAEPLDGGLTGAAVWKCAISGKNGPVAAVVAKLVKKDSVPGGLQDLLSLGQTISTFATLSGLIGGGYVKILQLAGDEPVGLMKLIDTDPRLAAEYVQPMLSALTGIQERVRLMNIGEICKPLLAWDEVVSLLEQYEIDVPPVTLTATANIGMRHGDLHPANILIDEGQAVLIDNDSNESGSSSWDPVTLLISTLAHRDSPLRGIGWPTTEEIEELYGEANFGDGHRCEDWFKTVNEWAAQRRASEREFWALTLAYSLRQLKYSDVLQDPETVDRVLALARKSVVKILAS